MFLRTRSYTTNCLAERQGCAGKFFWTGLLVKAKESESRYMILRRFTELNIAEAEVTEEDIRKHAREWDGYILPRTETQYYLREIKAAIQQAESLTQSELRPQDPVPGATSAEHEPADSVILTESDTTPGGSEMETTESELESNDTEIESVDSEANSTDPESEGRKEEPTQMLTSRLTSTAGVWMISKSQNEPSLQRQDKFMFHCNIN